jgi:hypothetical protein
MAMFRTPATTLLVFTAAFLLVGSASAQTRNPVRRDPISCSPAPCVLPPALASEGAGANIYAPIAVNPKNSKQLIVGSLDSECGRFTLVGFHVSVDAGSSWSTTCLTTFSEFGETWTPLDRPLVGFDLKGTAYIAGYYEDIDIFQYSLMGIETSSDGVTWSTPTATVGNDSTQIFFASLAVDRTASSPYVNSVYLLGINVIAAPQVLVSRSRDGGKTWNTAQVVAAPDNAWEYYPSLTIGRDGTLYATWMHCLQFGEHLCTSDIGYMVFSKSSDGGVTWSHPKLVRSVHEVPNSCGCYPFGTIPNTTVYPSNTPALGVDNSSGPYSGRLYATLFEWTGTYMRVGVIHSSDGGNTWSKPVPVAPASETHDQFFPWISVSPAGLVGVSWFDRRNDPANIDYQAYAAISSDGGESFRTNMQLTTAFSNPDNNGYDNFLGQYAGNTWDGPNYFIAAWMDTSNGISSQDYIGGIRLK